MKRTGLLPFLLVLCTTTSAYSATKEELAELITANSEYKQELQEKKEFVAQIERNAQRVGYNHAYQSVMSDFKKKLMLKEQYWDRLLSFNRVTSLVQEGAAKGLYLKGGIVDKVDNGTKLVDKNTIYTFDETYYLKEYPTLTINQPNWKDYLFKKEQLQLDLPPESLLPRNEKEKAVWKENLDIGWERGEQSAFKEIYNRWKTLFADLRGMTRYWTYVELKKITDVRLVINSQPTMHQINDTGEELTLNPTTIQIDAQATFNADVRDWNVIPTSANEDRRSSVRDAIISGHLNVDEVTNSQIIVTTPEFEKDYDSIPNTNQFK
ncbi:type IV secretion system DotC family protein [Vibrio fluvialis]|nr:type IV secretion system DotC family protein [Vibrio fluvialis]MBY7902403.1 type IV secretion system DotC family protein [Vibrio fluvialis]